MTSLLNIDNLLLGGGAAALVMICSVIAQLGGSRMDPRTSVTAGLGILALGMIGLLVVDLVPSLALLGPHLRRTAGRLDSERVGQEPGAGGQGLTVVGD
ncbi:hypothetical protein ABT116_39645, partial [Streptomyces sp. NPDC002130]